VSKRAMLAVGMIPGAIYHMERAPEKKPQKEDSNPDVFGGLDIDDPKAREALEKLLASREGSEKKIKPDQ
jgi:hypothetical protein